METFNCETILAMRKDWSCALHRQYRSIAVLVSAIMEGSCIDLTAPVDSLGTPETLSDLIHIRKEGPLTCAKLYAADYVRAELVSAGSQLKKFLSDFRFGRGLYRDDYESRMNSEDDSSESM